MSAYDFHPPFLTYEQLGDALEAMYGGSWSWDDPEWWSEMIEALYVHGTAWLQTCSGNLDDYSLVEEREHHYAFLASSRETQETGDGVESNS